MQTLRCAAAIACLLACGGLAHTVAAISQLGPHLVPCVQGRSKVAAECGTFGVYENRATHTGRVIALRVVVLRAKHPSARAIAFIAGGPGESTTPFAAPIADGAFEKALPALRDRYNILFVDDRGMGGSHPFTCDFAPRDDPRSYFRQLWPDGLVSACRDKSAATHDLSMYNTNNTVDDLDDVRAALHYPKLVLHGGSYGTFLSLIYMRRHPNHVESVVLDGVDPPHFEPLPGAPDGAQTALDDLIKKCARDAMCRSHFPAFRRNFAATVQRLGRGTLAVPVNNPLRKRIETVRLSKEVFVDQLRHLLYDSESAAYVPYVIERAYRGDYVPLGRLINIASQLFSQGVNMGANLSYTCAEWMPFLDPRAVSFAAAHSFAGDLRIGAQRRACKIWSVPPMPPSFNDPVRSANPVLMIAASDDPATPPRYGEEALRYLPNGKEVLVKGAGHATQTPCTDRLTEQFIRAGSVKALDVTQCTSNFKLPPFATSLKGLPQV